MSRCVFHPSLLELPSSDGYVFYVLLFFSAKDFCSFCNGFWEPVRILRARACGSLLLRFRIKLSPLSICVPLAFRWWEHSSFFKVSPLLLVMFYLFFPLFVSNFLGRDYPFIPFLAPLTVPRLCFVLRACSALSPAFDIPIFPFNPPPPCLSSRFTHKGFSSITCTLKTAQRGTSLLYYPAPSLFHGILPLTEFLVPYFFFSVDVDNVVPHSFLTPVWLCFSSSKCFSQVAPNFLPNHKTACIPLFFVLPFSLVCPYGCPFPGSLMLPHCTRRRRLLFQLLPPPPPPDILKTLTCSIFHQIYPPPTHMLTVFALPRRPAFVECEPQACFPRAPQSSR